MTIHLQKEIENLKESLLTLTSIVATYLDHAIKSLLEGNVSLAQEVVRGDEEVDLKEVEVEEECLKIMALHQPVAIDLRFIIAVLKINNDLERIGDLAVNIAETALYFASHPRLESLLDLPELTDRVLEMLRESLNAFVTLDVGLARKVLKMDEKVDEIHRGTYQLVAERILKDAVNASGYMRMLSVSRYLERIADHATNIAEDVIYMVEGTIVRHAGA